MKIIFHPNKKLKTLMIAVIIILISSINLHAAQISGVNFSEEYKEGQTKMLLQGVGVKSMVFFKAFAAGYYTTDSFSGLDLGEFPKRIEVRYFVSIPAKKLNEFTIEKMRENINAQEFSNLKNQCSLMEKYFVNLKPGDRFSLTYIPASGTKFEHNGVLMGTIAGADFARALFSVWIGEKPFDERLKEQIMGSKKQQTIDYGQLVKK